jgi:hypothetical protein
MASCRLRILRSAVPKLINAYISGTLRTAFRNPTFLIQHLKKLVNEYLVSFSKRILLECRCGERLLLLGLEKDWRAERRTTFKCGGCGAKLSLDGVSSKGLRRQALRTAASSIIHRVP